MPAIASVSFGKDSLAMLLYIIENHFPLDEVIFYDTGMEFKSIYRNRDKIIEILKHKNIAFKELKPQNSFLYDMIERPVTSKTKGSHYGYGWCGGRCRWGTTWKIQSLDKYAANATVHYIGIAADEPARIKRLSSPKIAPLANIGMTEIKALQYCRDRGWNWHEETTATKTGYIDLYDILDRVSCWCCGNKNRRELKNIYQYLPQYWKQLEFIQDKIERPMKNFSNQKYGEYGNVHRMAEVFHEELYRYK